MHDSAASTLALLREITPKKELHLHESNPNDSWHGDFMSPMYDSYWSSKRVAWLNFHKYPGIEMLAIVSDSRRNKGMVEIERFIPEEDKALALMIQQSRHVTCLNIVT
jgi:hypothetical protein